MFVADPMPTKPPSERLGRRRHVTVLFSDLSGSSEYAERLEAEEYARLLERFRELARGIVSRCGGTIARLQGDGLLALFSQGSTHGDDGVCAVEAALELHGATANLPVGERVGVIRMHSGVHSGPVLVFEGDIERGRLDVVGEVPNTAARLCGMAAAGEILASDESLGPLASLFCQTDRRTLAIRGRSAALSVVRIEHGKSIERRYDPATPRRLVRPFEPEDLLGVHDETGGLKPAAHNTACSASPVLPASRQRSMRWSWRDRSPARWLGDV